MRESGGVCRTIRSRQNNRYRRSGKKPETRRRRDATEELWREWIRVRIRYDFEFWAFSFVRIKDKLGAEDIPFRLNRPQRLHIGDARRYAHGGKTHSPHLAQSPAMGRFHSRTNLYGMDSAGALPQLEQRDLRPSQRIGRQHQGHVQQTARQLSRLAARRGETEVQTVRAHGEHIGHRRAGVQGNHRARPRVRNRCGVSTRRWLTSRRWLSGGTAA